jgi:hypothetical protein
MAGYLHSMLGMFGLGDEYNPMAKYQQELTQAKDDLTNTIATGTMKVLQSVDSTIEQTYKFIVVSNQYSTFERKFAFTIEQFSSGSNQTQIVILAALLLVIIMYLFFSPK